MTAILETPTPATGLPITYSCGCSYVTPFEELCDLCAADVLKVQRETMRGVCDCGMPSQYRGGRCDDCAFEIEQYRLDRGSRQTQIIVRGRILGA